MSELEPEAKIAIQQEVQHSVRRIAALFGVANLAVVLVAIWSFWSFAQRQVPAVAESVETRVFSELTSTKDELRTAVNEANQLIGRLQERVVDLDALDGRLDSIKNRVAQLENEELVAGASQFLESWDGSRDVDELVKVIDGLVGSQGSLGCKSPRLFSGTAVKGSLDWQPYNGKRTSVFTTIDTRAAKFSSAPLYFISLEGGGSWSAQGASAIYARAAESFDVYLKWSPSSDADLVKYASENWTIQWLGIGC